ncbi:Lipoprotein [Candidatus Electrothrix aarhusensis]
MKKTNRLLGLEKMEFFNILLLATLLPLLSGCFLTKLVTVPMRMSGAAISVLPVVGNTAHDAIDEAAEVVDNVPL